MRKILSLMTGGLLIAGLCVTPSPVASSAAVNQASGDAGGFSPVTATRVLDTRSGMGGYKGMVAPGRTVTFTVSKYPGYTQAAVIDVTVPKPAPAGSLSVYPSGTGWDGRVTMTLTGGGNIQQQLTVAHGADGGVTIRNNGPYATHVLVSVLGYYGAGAAMGAGMFAPANGRVLDTRKGIGAPGVAVGAGKKVTVAFAGRGGIPAGGARAVIANVAVLSARTTGQLVITDSDGKLVTTRLRFVGNQSVPQTMQTERVVKLGGNGSLTFTNSSASSVHLVVDVFGYFLLTGSGYANGAYHPLSPQPVTALALHGLTPRGFSPPGFPLDYSIAANLVMTTDRPAQPVALGIYPSTEWWSGSPVVSSSASLQPTEFVVYTGAESVTVRSLYDTDVALHCYVTGYYSWDPTRR